MKLILTLVSPPPLGRLLLNLLVSVLTYSSICVGYLMYVTRSAEVVTINEKRCYVIGNVIVRDLLKTAGYKCSYSANVLNVFDLGINLLTPPWKFEVRTVGVLTSIKQK